MNKPTSSRHDPSECTSARCADDQCANGTYGISEPGAAQLLVAAPATATERAVVASGHAHSQPIETMAAIRNDLDFALGVLTDGPLTGNGISPAPSRGHLPLRCDSPSSIRTPPPTWQRGPRARSAQESEGRVHDRTAWSDRV